MLTTIESLIAVPPTVAIMVEAFTTVNELAATPPSRTLWVAVKFEPVMVTVLPGPTSAGLIEPITGAPAKKKPPCDAESYGIETVTFPEPPAPTTAVRVSGETRANDCAGTPPKETDVILSR